MNIENVNDFDEKIIAESEKLINENFDEIIVDFENDAFVVENKTLIDENEKLIIENDELIADNFIEKNVKNVIDCEMSEIMNNKNVIVTRFDVINDANLTTKNCCEFFSTTRFCVLIAVDYEIVFDKNEKFIEKNFKKLKNEIILAENEKFENKKLIVEIEKLIAANIKLIVKNALIDKNEKLIVESFENEINEAFNIENVIVANFDIIFCLTIIVDFENDD